MSRLSKVILSIVVLLVVIVAGLSIALPRLINPNNYKEQIRKAVAQATGRDLAINGDIKWRVFPEIALKMPEMVLTDKANKGNLVTVAETEVKIKLWPLLRKNISVDQIKFSFTNVTWLDHSTGKTQELELDHTTINGMASMERDKFNLDGMVSIDHAKVMGLNANKITIPVLATDSSIKVGPVKAAFYDGEYTANWQADTKQKPATWNLEQQLTNANLSDMLRDYTGRNNWLGTIAFSSKVKSVGFEPTKVLANLQGDAELKLQDGSYQGIDLGYQWAMAQKLLHKGEGDVPANTGRTEIANLSGNWQITNGIAKNDNLVIVNPMIYTKGQGVVDLNQQTLDYQLQTSGAKRLESGAIEPQGTAVPLKVDGSLSQPSVKVDIADVKQTVLKEAGQRLLNNEKVKDALGGLLGN